MKTNYYITKLMRSFSSAFKGSTVLFTLGTATLGTLAKADVPRTAPEVEVLKDESDPTNITADINVSRNVANKYLVGVGVKSIQDDSEFFLADGVSITVDNTNTYFPGATEDAGAGAIGLATSLSQIGEIAGDITVTGTIEAHGLGISNLPYFGSSTTTYEPVVEAFSGNIDVTSRAGEALGINIEGATLRQITSTAIINVDANEHSSGLGGSAAAKGIQLSGNSRIDSITGAIITLETDGFSSSATGIHIGSLASVGSITDVTMSATAKNGQIKLVVGEFNPLTTLENTKISGDFTMISNSTYATEYSVGYLLGTSVRSTTFSLAFANTFDAPGVQDTSAGLNVDWENTNLIIHRELGFAAGAVVVGIDDENIKKTTLGAGNQIKVSTGTGSAVGAWINGTDVSEGALEGTMTVHSDLGSAIGIGTVGTSISGSSGIYQSNANSKIKDIGGKIMASVNEVNTSSGSAAVGIQLANVDIVNGELTTYTTEMVGSFSGEITAQLNNVSSAAADGASVNQALEAFNADPDNVVAGIVDMGTQTLKFDGVSVGENNAAGTSVSALIYDTTTTTGTGGSTEQKSLVAYGDAIKTIAGNITVTTNSTNANNTTKFTGNLTAGILGDKALEFEAGHFTATGNNWNAREAISIGTEITNATVQLVDIVDVDSGATDDTSKTINLNTDTLNFHGSSTSDFSKLLVGENLTLNFDGLKTVNVYLDGSVADWQQTIYFADGRAADSFDGSNLIDGSEEAITYKLFIGGEEIENTDLFGLRHDSTGIYLYIPEPSTATLSLLALASLLARRRRKA